MKRLFMMFVLLFVTTPASAKPRPWTFEFRSGWNQACFEALAEQTKKHGYKVNEVGLRNLCDCSSDLLQDRYSQQQVEAFGDHPPADFIEWGRESVKLCLEPKSDPI